MKPISDLNFGYIDASTYLQHKGRPEGDFFAKSFHRSFHLDRAVDPDVFFLIGEKGTGKSAYAVYASECMSDYNASTILFVTADFTRFIEIASHLGLSKSQYSLLWSFAFSLAFLSHARAHLGEIESPILKALLSTVSELTLGGDARQISQSLALANEIDAFFSAFSAHNVLQIPKHTILGAKPEFKLSRLVDLIAEGLATLNGQFQFTLFLDGLDVRPDEVAYESYLSVISSICNTIWLLNSTKLSRATAPLKIVLLTRPDIFDVVSIQNRGPKLQDHSHLVEWSARYKTFEASELFKLTDRMLRIQQNDGEKLLEGDAWQKYFNFKVYNRANNKEDDDPFVIFLRHSFYRPRDILQYLKVMSETVRQTLRPGVDKPLAFTPEIFRDRTIRDLYSGYLMEEIRDQLSFYYTNAEYQQFLDFNQGYLGRYLDRNTRVFIYDDFCKAHTEFLAYNARNNIDTVPSFSTADTLLQFMFELNVVGYHQTRTRRSGEKFVVTNYCFRQRTFANLRPKIPTDGEYVMHYGVAKWLFVWFV